MAWVVPGEVDALLAVLRKHGVRSFKTGDVHVELSPSTGGESSEEPEPADLDPEMRLLTQDPVIRRLIVENARAGREG
jgi:hypothetical protein